MMNRNRLHTRLTTTLRTVASVALAASWVACGVAEDAAEAPELGAVVVTQWVDATELFLEYPFLVAGQQTGNWAIHLTERDGFEPIRAGTLQVRFTAEGAVAEMFTVDAPLRDGIFLLDPVIARPGIYEVELMLESDQVNSRHVVPNVLVHSSGEEALAYEPAEELAGVSFLKEQQWVIPFAVHPVEEHAVQRTVRAPGEIVPPDGALVRVSAPVQGIAEARSNRSAPSVGDRVSEGQVLAVLSPTSQEGGFAQSRGQVERLRREVERDQTLFDAGAIPARRLEESRHDLEIAEAELLAIGGGTEGSYQLTLRSPMAGVIAERTFVPGGRVEAGESLFTVVDPSRAWVRVQVSAAIAGELSPGATSLFTIDNSEEVFDSRLRSIGSVINPATRTVPVVFQVSGGQGPFAFGTFVQATVPTGESVTGIAIPNAAILDENGTPVAYVQAGGETFERRILTTGVTDGRRTHIVAGLRPGDMVVTVGAYQVRLASLSGGDFAGGHAH
ncbi:MAG: efflux RND transporter periplasmic adaptor subunit [Gemmatimonadota bacterium]|nr:efflux RND transporter periplasmic adaptor subunit [Gemmatimonadota bacterium]MDH3422723.1 efflux RND transporter periplasmic adaptor subunit [Gemmatimonadota bacterium]